MGIHAIYATEEEVEKAIERRLTASGADKKEVLAHLLGEAVEALLEINRTIPADSGYRGLVAHALQKFANGAGD